MAKRGKNKPAPPPDLHNYTLIKTKEGSYWRRKRGTVNPAKLNATLKRSSRAMAVTSPAARRIKDKLHPFLQRLDTGRFIAIVSGKLRKAYNQTGKISLLPLQGYEMQPYFHLNQLLDTSYNVFEKKGEIIIEINLGSRSVRQLNQIVTEYYFDAILLHGDPSKPNGLRIESDTSPLYDINSRKQTTCRLSLLLPTKKTSWIVLLKVSCREGDEPAAHPRHYGMKVIMTGS
jgi:hypothetical protein